MIEITWLVWLFIVLTHVVFYLILMKMKELGLSMMLCFSLLIFSILLGSNVIDIVN